MKFLAAPSLAMLLVGGCASEPERFDPNDHVTIEQGIFGTASWSSDISNDGRPSSDLIVGVRDPANTAWLGYTTTDDHGFFELALAPGDYLLVDVSTRFACATLTVPVGLRQLRYLSSIYPVWDSLPSVECPEFPPSQP